LPESELDRFMIKISMGYPSYDIEKLMILNGDPSERLPDIQSVLTKQDVLDIMKHVKHIHVSEDVADVLMFIVQKNKKTQRCIRRCVSKGYFANDKSGQILCLLDG